jgi:rRNA maturation endonuclease Nob1
VPDDAPKSALDLVLERLKKKDAEAGIEERPLTDAQRTAITEARSVHEARAAERRIMHQSAMRNTFDPAERETLEESLRRDLERFEADRDSKIRKIREQG